MIGNPKNSSQLKKHKSNSSKGTAKQLDSTLDQKLSLHNHNNSNIYTEVQNLSLTKINQKHQQSEEDPRVIAMEKAAATMSKYSENRQKYHKDIIIKHRKTNIHTGLGIFR